MGLHEYRPPSAYGGITPSWIYRDDLRWLAQAAEETSRWLSANGREVHYDAADVIHELVETRRAQGSLLLKPPEAPWPVFWRGKVRQSTLPVKSRPRASGASGYH